MHSRLILYLTLIITIAVHVNGSLFSNPFNFGKLQGVVKNEARKLSNNIEADVRQMQIKNPFSSMLIRGHPVDSMPTASKGPRLQHPFNWTSCGGSGQVFDIKSLSFKPSPLSFPGDLTFSFDIVVHEDIREEDNITAVVKLEYHAGSTWAPLPCLGLIGSCTYDVCKDLDGVQCPPDITEQGVKCNCPLPKGEYKLQPYTQTVLSEVFINGDFRARINMNSKNGPIACYKIAFTVG